MTPKNAAAAAITEHLKALNQVIDDNFDVATYEADPNLRAEFDRLEVLLAILRKRRKAKNVIPRKPAQTDTGRAPVGPEMGADQNERPKEPANPRPVECGCGRIPENAPASIPESAVPASRLSVAIILVGFFLAAFAVSVFSLFAVSSIREAKFSDLLSEPMKRFLAEGAYVLPRSKLADGMVFTITNDKVTECYIRSPQ